MKRREDIERILRAHKAGLAEKYGVCEIGIFGSHSIHHIKIPSQQVADDAAEWQ